MFQQLRFLRGRSALVAATAAAVVLGLVDPGPAAADDSVNIQISGFGQSLVIDPNFNTSYPGTSDDTQVASQCVDVPGFGKWCSGLAGEPVDVRGQEEFNGVIKDVEAQAAIGWMVPEAIEAIRVLHDLPNDGRVERYGRPAIRAWMVLRLQGIMDSYVYGQPLTDDEQRALDWLNAELAADDLTLAQSAWDEYDRYANLDCAYRPPAAPTAIDKAVKLPDDVQEWCSHLHSQASQLFTFAPPIPSATAFTNWGAYAKSKQLGLEDLGDPEMAENVRSAIVSGAVFGSIGAAAGVGALAGTLAVAAGLAAKIATKILPHATRAFFSAGQTIAGSSGALVGAIAAAVIAFAVVVFLVVTAVATWQLIQHDSVGTTLRDRLDEARTTSDPLGMEEYRDDWSGLLPVGSEYDRDDPPSYLSEAATMKTTLKVAQVTTVVNDPAAPPQVQGSVIGDPKNLWAGNATKSSDFRFVKRVGDGPRTVLESVVLPTREGDIKVRFSQGWMILDDEKLGTRPAVSFPWTSGGDKVEVSRAPAAVGGWQISRLENGNHRYRGESVVNLSYRNDDDQLVSIGLTNPAKKYDTGPRPSAVGPLTTGRVVNLRPNPVTPTGISVDPAQAANDYDFAWTVSEQQPDGTWQEVTTGTSYGLAFTPQVAGQYRAEVTMTAVGDPTQQQVGYVEFPIQPPVIATPVLALQDNGSSRLEVDLQVQEEVPGDDLTVTVTWPGDVGSTTDPTTSLPLDCIQTGPLDCTSPRTGTGDLLVRTLTNRTDLRRPVTVTVTNSAGSAVTQQFLLGGGRPQVAPPPGGVNGSLPGSVLVSEGTAQLTMPIEDANRTYSVATLVPTVSGNGFGLVDPATGATTSAIPIPGTHNLIAKVENFAGAWQLEVQGTLIADEVGTYELPVVVSETSTKRMLVMMVVHVVPSTGDRYRGGLHSDVDPLDFATATLPEMFPTVLGGTAAWPAYDGGMCVSLQYRDFGQQPRQTCGPLSEFFTPDGVARPFPYAALFPGGMSSGSYEAKAWLTDTDATRVDPAPLWSRFLLTEDAVYGNPEIVLGRVGISGRPVVGQRLRSRVEDVYPGGVDVTFRWLRDDRRIRGATGSSYLLTGADAGHRLTVVVTATRSGWTTDTRASQPTNRVRRG